MLPFSFLLFEFTLFGKNTNKCVVRALVLICTFITLASIFALLNGSYVDNFFNADSIRLFSPFERLLSEFRILLLYLGLIFYPIPSRLSLDHSFTVSRSFFDPPSTIFSILFIVVLIIVLVRYRHKYPFITIAFLFYFLNHIVESSLIPLELIFEHRNYLPSAFLFLPISVFFVTLLAKYSPEKSYMQVIISVFISLLVLLFGMGTYTRNFDYQTSDRLWQDTLAKNPKSSRALQHLGISAGWGASRSEESLNKALQLNLAALNDDTFYHRKNHKAALLNNIGGILTHYDKLDMAIAYYNKAIDYAPDFHLSLFNLARTYLKMGNFQKSLETINKLIESSPPSGSYFNIQGLALLWLKKPGDALVSYQRAMAMLSDKKIAYHNIGSALSQSGHYRQAEWFLRQAQKNEPESLMISLSLLDTYLREGNESKKNDQVEHIYNNFTIQTIVDTLSILSRNYGMPPLDKETISDSLAYQSLRDIFNYEPE